VRYKRYSNCLSTVTPYCNVSVKDYLQGLDDGYGFLCSATDDEFNRLVEYQKCYGKAVVVEAVKFCNESYVSKMQTINQVESPYDRVELFCKYMDIYLKCLTDTVQEACNASAAEWQRLWNRKKRQQQMSGTFNCPGWNDEADNQSATIWTIILSVVLGLTTLIMIVGILVILVFINRKKKSHRRAAIPPPPPYTSDPCMAFNNGPVVNSQEEELEPEVTLSTPSGSPSAGSPANQSTAVNMRPSAHYLVKPPPYSGQQAPEYESVCAASNGASHGGAANAAFEEEEVCGSTDIAEGGAVGINGRGGNMSPSSAEKVTDSERELNTDWF